MSVKKISEYRKENKQISEYAGLITGKILSTQRNDTEYIYKR